MFSRAGTIAIDEVLALVGHAVLNRYAAAQRLDPLDVPRRNRLRVVEEPSHPIHWHVTMNALEDVKKARDGLVVRGMQAERPPMFDEMTHDRIQIGFHRRWEVGPRLDEVLEISSGEGQHLACAVQPV